MALKLFLLGVMLLFPAIEARDLPKARECAKKVPNYHRESCEVSIMKYRNTSTNMDTSNPTMVAAFVKNCKIMQPCHEYVKCESTDRGLIEAHNMIASLCDITEYLGTEFNACREKLEAKNSECYDNWNPFPAASTTGEESTAEMEEKQKLACKNFFGKNNCVKKEIVAACGKEEFVKLSKRLAALNKILETCSFGDQW